MTTKTACTLLRSLDGITEKDHFGSDGFYANKRLFATIWHDRGEINLRLNPLDQQRFLSIDGDAFSAIDNAWGRQGWTCAHLEFVEIDQFIQVIKAAWAHSSKKSGPLSAKTRSGSSETKKVKSERKRLAK